MSRAHLALAAFALVLVTAAVTLQVSAQAATPADAVCTPTKMKVNAEAHAADLEAAVEAHLAAGRTHVQMVTPVQVSTMGSIVCAW